MPLSFKAFLAGFQDFLTHGGYWLFVFSHSAMNCLVFGSVKYPLPKSPYSNLRFAISWSRSTLAMIDAAETIG